MSKILSRPLRRNDSEASNRIKILVTKSYPPPFLSKFGGKPQNSRETASPSKGGRPRTWVKMVGDAQCCG